MLQGHPDAACLDLGSAFLWAPSFSARLSSGGCRVAAGVPGTHPSTWQDLYHCMAWATCPAHHCGWELGGADWLVLSTHLDLPGVWA